MLLPGAEYQKNLLVASFLIYILSLFSVNEDPVVNVSFAHTYVITDHAPAPAVPPAMSNLSSVEVAPPLNE